MQWANFFHIYQPPHWPQKVIRRVVRESYRPLVGFLLSNRNIRITLNISASLTEQLNVPAYQDILKGLRHLLTRKQIELTDSAKFHAILPLLPETEIRRQVMLNRRTNRQIIGPAYRPRGFFPPEMAYSPELGRILHHLGYRWVILDGIAHPGIVDYTTRYRLPGTRLYPVFRNRYVSDYLAFVAQPQYSNRFFDAVQYWNYQTEVLITAMDGENLGHHRRVTKRIWRELVGMPHVTTVTISDLLRALTSTAIVKPRASSWSSQPHELNTGTPFGLWHHPANRLHRLQWELFQQVVRLVHSRERRRQAPEAVRAAFDEAVGSDWYWWASREPWWDVDIVIQSAIRLRVIADVLGVSGRQQERIHGLVKKISDLANRWHQSGAALRHATSFLKRDQGARYLGGERVNVKRLRSRRSQTAETA